MRGAAESIVDGINVLDPPNVVVLAVDPAGGLLRNPSALLAFAFVQYRDMFLLVGLCLAELLHIRWLADPPTTFGRNFLVHLLNLDVTGRAFLRQRLQA